MEEKSQSSRLCAPCVLSPADSHAVGVEQQVTCAHAWQCCSGRINPSVIDGCTTVFSWHPTALKALKHCVLLLILSFPFPELVLKPVPKEARSWWQRVPAHTLQFWWSFSLNKYLFRNYLYRACFKNENVLVAFSRCFFLLLFSLWWQWRMLLKGLTRGCSRQQDDISLWC